MKVEELLRRGELSHGEEEEEEDKEEEEEDEEAAAGREDKRRRGIVPAEPVKPVMKAILASRGAIYSL